MVKTGESKVETSDRCHSNVNISFALKANFSLIKILSDYLIFHEMKSNIYKALYRCIKALYIQTKGTRNEN